MKLSTRLWLYGALVPALLLLAAFVVVGALLDQELRLGIDRALQAQAAVESVSLFDRLDHAPHLHLDRSPLPESMRLESATGALYGPDGALVAVEPADAEVPRRLAPLPWLRAPTLATVGRTRELMVPVHSPDGHPHVLRLAVSLQRHQDTMWAYVRAAALTSLAVAVGLFVLQWRQALGVHGRVMRLHAHMERLHAGDLDGQPAPDDHGDVLTQLRDGIADATDRLRAARTHQDRLLADAAHELRTPLAAMRTDIDVTLRRDRQPEELRDALDRTRGEVDRLAHLSTRLLDLASLRHTQAQVLRHDVVPLVRDAVAAMAAAAHDRGLTLDVQAPPTHVAAVDAAAWRQIVDNLLANALRFANTRVTLTVADLGDRWQFTVQDDGPGVPEAQRDAIFAPFHRPDKRGTGSGLGLAIVRDAVARHGGHVSVHAALPHGARFVVEMPAARSSAEEGADAV